MEVYPYTLNCLFFVLSIPGCCRNVYFKLAFRIAMVWKKYLDPGQAKVLKFGVWSGN